MLAFFFRPQHVQLHFWSHFINMDKFKSIVDKLSHIH